MSRNMFPAFLYAAAIAAEGAPPLAEGETPAVEKKLFQSPFQVTGDRAWFEDRELTRPYQAPAHAPPPKSAEDRVALLERELDRKDDELGALRNENALFAARLDKIAAATGVKFDDTDGDDEPPAKGNAGPSAAHQRQAARKAKESADA